jgi:hypothetical protein
MSRRPNALRLTEKYDAGNREAAEIILADPERYAGLPLEWARLWMERHPKTEDRDHARDFENNFEDKEGGA